MLQQAVIISIEISEKIENLNKEIEIIKKDQLEITGLKNTVTKMKMY